MTSGLLTTGTYLDRIVSDKRDELELLRRERPIEDLRSRISEQPGPHDFEASLRSHATETRPALIAEIKKASPSKGVLMQGTDSLYLARCYTAGGAAAISIVTEKRHFQGSLQVFLDVRVALDREFELGRPPLLRKDFLFDPYHIEESRAFSADAILLIAALLDDERLKELLEQARELGMTALVEVHDQDEIRRAVDAGATVVGVNNRDLRTFQEDLGTTERLARYVAGSDTPLLVSESAISSADDVRRVATAGARAVLIGEALVTAPDPLAKIQELLP